MPGSCGVCSGDVERTNSDGSYKGACAECRGSNPLDRTPHVQACDREACIVCEDYEAEFGRDGKQQTLF